MRAGALCLLCRTPCATSISQLCCSISVAGWRPISSLSYAVLNFDFAASLLHLSRGLAPYIFSVVRRALLRFRSFAAPSQSRAGALCLLCRTPCATSIPQFHCFISVAGWRPMPSLPYAVRYFDSAALLLHLSRGLAPYNDNKKCLTENKFSSDTFIIVARLVAITKVLVFLCITDSRFLLV